MAQATQKHHRPTHQRRAVVFDPKAEIDALIIEPSLVPDLSFLGSMERACSVESPVAAEASVDAADNTAPATAAPDVDTVLKSATDIVLRLPMNSVMISNPDTPFKSEANMVLRSEADIVPRSEADTVFRSELNTVPMSPQTPVTPEMNTVLGLPLNTVAGPDENTVLRSDSDTVLRSMRTIPVSSEMGIVLRLPLNTVVTPDENTVVRSGMDTVAAPKLSAVSAAESTDERFRDLHVHTQRPSKSGPARVGVWVTEAGEMVVEGRVQRIDNAKDMLTGNEALVYELLWKESKRKAEKRKYEKGPTLVMDGEMEKLVQAGHNDLRKTGLSQSTIRRVRQSLLDKDFVSIEQAPDILRRTPTIFRVFSFEATLKRQQSKGRFYQAKIGPGHSFVWPLQAAQYKQGSTGGGTVVNSYVSTVANSDVNTVVNPDMDTPSKESTLSMVSSDMSTVFEENTRFKDKDLLLERTTATEALLLDSAEIRREFARYALVPDQRALAAMIAACQAQVPDLTTEELIFFLREKGSVVRSSSSVENPTGFLLKVVPRCFEGDLFSEWRTQREVEERAAAVEFGKQAIAAAIHEELDAAPANNFWKQIMSSLRQIVNPHTFDWLVPLRYLRLEAGKLLVWMPGEEWRYPALRLREQIFTTIHDLALPITQVQFVTDEQVPELCVTLND